MGSIFRSPPYPTRASRSRLPQRWSRTSRIRRCSGRLSSGSLRTKAKAATNAVQIAE